MPSKKLINELRTPNLLRKQGTNAEIRNMKQWVIPKKRSCYEMMFQNTPEPFWIKKNSIDEQHESQTKTLTFNLSRPVEGQSKLEGITLTKVK